MGTVSNWWQQFQQWSSVWLGHSGNGVGSTVSVWENRRNVFDVAWSIRRLALEHTTSTVPSRSLGAVTNTPPSPTPLSWECRVLDDWTDMVVVESKQFIVTTFLYTLGIIAVFALVEEHGCALSPPPCGCCPFRFLCGDVLLWATSPTDKQQSVRGVHHISVLSRHKIKCLE